MNFHFGVVSLILVASCFATQMTIDKITVVNKCAKPVYFANSNPKNGKIGAGDTWSADWMIGGGNVKGRFAFSYLPDTFSGTNSGDQRTSAWVEFATDSMKPGVPIEKKNFNFVNSQGIIDLDLQISALTSSGSLVCPDAKARTALDPNACSTFPDASAKVENGFCNFLYGGDGNACATSDNGRYACTSSFANYVSDHSMIWVADDGSSATSGHWLAQARSTGRSSGEAEFPSKPAAYEDAFVGQPSLNGRVGCNARANGGKAVNFECYESCCYPRALGPSHASVERQHACESVGGVSAGTQGFVACEGHAGDVHVANLEIVLCPARSELSSSSVKMPSCPADAPAEYQNQNPFTWEQAPGQFKGKAKPSLMV
jgi:hypothetical protein